MAKVSWSLAMVGGQPSRNLLVETGMPTVSYLLSGVTFCIYRCSLIWLCCRYEGEFYAGFPHGLGVYTAANGQTYRGEWAFGKKHG